ncbi:YbaK/EbsC family protein [Streptomyces sp. NPDC014802]|uniref:YbaK/EbsC family protein n=1 Tax=Streptomyces sp. NPDC014802 TaxID=3364917 RepID=UPI0036F67E26
MQAPIGHFDQATPAPDCLDELTRPIADAVRHWRGSVPAEQIVYVDTDPQWADTLAACVVLSTTRVDVNGVVRRHLGVRKASFASMDTATGETGMEYGGITPVGLPEAWPVLVDAAVVDLPYVLVGSGRRRGKLLVPGKAFAELPGAVVLEGLGVA